MIWTPKTLLSGNTVLMHPKKKSRHTEQATRFTTIANGKSSFIVTDGAGRTVASLVFHKQNQRISRGVRKVRREKPGINPARLSLNSTESNASQLFKRDYNRPAVRAPLVMPGKLTSYQGVNILTFDTNANGGVFYEDSGAYED